MPVDSNQRLKIVPKVWYISKYPSCLKSITTGNCIHRVLRVEREKMAIYEYEADDTDVPPVSTKISLTDPITHYSCGNGRHTTYLIELESNDVCFSKPKSMTRRRFSEFLYLRRLLKVLQPHVEAPALHSKNYFFRDRFNPEFILQRRQQLETFIQQVISQPLYLSNKALHLFLQYELPMREIEAQVSGVLPIIPLEADEIQASVSDSSTSTVSSGSSECHMCDYAHGNISFCSNPRCAFLLSTNHEAFVTLPFLPCSNDIHVTPKKPKVSKGFCHSIDATATSSKLSSHSVPESVCSSCTSNSIESSQLSKKVSFADGPSIDTKIDLDLCL